MGKKDFMARQHAIQNAFFQAGVQAGRQQILDMAVLVLHDPEIMGKDTFGKERLIKFISAVGDYIDTFQKAWEKDDETDYYREKMDELLARALGEGLRGSFQERYETAPEFDYVKGRWH